MRSCTTHCTCSLIIRNMAMNLESSYTSWKARSFFKKWLQLDRIILVIVILFIWVLLAVPFISYYLNQNKNSTSTEDSVFVDKCSSSILYNGSVCNEVFLQHITECGKNISSHSKIRVINENIEEVELFLTDMTDTISDECMKEAKPFLCLYLLEGICLQNGIHILPTSEECLRISQSICQELWEILSWQGVKKTNCDSLPIYSSQCSKYDNIFVPNVVTTPDMLHTNTCSLNCQERFFCDNLTSKCVPHCPDFSLYSPTTTLLTDTLVGLCAWLGFLAGIAVIIVSIIRRKTVLTFPSILAVYETLSIMIKDVIQIIVYFDRGFLYCTSPNLLESFLNISPYCILSGMVQVAYIPLQFNIWWVTHMVILYLSICFPFKIKTKPVKRCLQGVHVVVVIAGLLVPAVPIVAIIVGSTLQDQEYGTAGIRLGTPPTILCAIQSVEISFAFIVMPNCILALTGITAIALLIWTVHRNYGIMKTIRSRASSPLSTTEVKLLLVISYFIVLEVLFFAFATQRQEDLNPLFEYFQCEESGVDPDNPCSRDRLENDLSQYIFTFYYCSLLIIPAVCFVFVIDFGMIKNSIKKIYITTTSYFQSR